MIPIDPNKPKIYKDDKTGIEYQFRYVTEEIEDDFFAIAKKYEVAEGEQLTIQNFKSYTKDIINFFLVGWCGDNLPEFSKDNPARFFIGSARLSMYKLIEKLIPELTGTEIEEVKN